MAGRSIYVISAANARCVRPAKPQIGERQKESRIRLNPMARRATGCHWRGHKVYADLRIRAGAELVNCSDLFIMTALAESKHRGFKPCRADGSPLQDYWIISYQNQHRRVKDADVIDVSNKRIIKARG